MAKQALGKGLGALIKKSVAPSTTDALVAPDDFKRVRDVPLDHVVPSPLQPRTQFVESPLDDLMESIRQHGIIQPLIVRMVDGKLELIAGERRWRASKKLGLTTVPVIEREASDRDVLEMALIENLQREDLNPMEEAAGYVRLAEEFSLKQDEIAARVGKSRASVANAMRLLGVPAKEVLSQDLPVAVALTVIGTALVGLGSGIYIGSGNGPGPRDGLMTGFHRLTGRPIWIVRTIIEIVVGIIGILLGGTFGFGTIWFACQSKVHATKVTTEGT